MSFERYAVVRVPFPFTDHDTAKNRPALILSDPSSFNEAAGHSVMAMITSLAHSPWPLDCPLVDLTAAGLPAPSKVRFKLFTLDHRLVRGMLGALAPADVANVRLALNQLLGPPYREPGSMRGQISIADDFDAPLDDFKDYQ